MRPFCPSGALANAGGCVVSGMAEGAPDPSAVALVEPIAPSPLGGIDDLAAVTETDVSDFLVALLGVVVHIVEANVIAPMIMERQVSLPPVLTLLSVLVMAHLMHLVGLLVAVPVLATTLVVVRRIYVYRVLEGKGFRRAVRDQPVEVRLPDDVAVLVHPAAKETSIPSMLESGG